MIMFTSRTRTIVSASSANDQRWSLIVRFRFAAALAANSVATTSSTLTATTWPARDVVCFRRDIFGEGRKWGPDPISAGTHHTDTLDTSFWRLSRATSSKQCGLRGVPAGAPRLFCGKEPHGGPSKPDGDD